ncbi:MAG: hypothetical protein KDA42_08265 [Planctomycetales bacterium]|nr:hypothetical protein [Planctomycetales bacterium]
MPDDQTPTPLGPRRGQLTLGRMLLIMTLLSVAAATVGGLAQGGFRRQTLMIMGLVAPVGIMIALSLWIEIRRRWRR